MCEIQCLIFELYTNMVGEGQISHNSSIKRFFVQVSSCITTWKGCTLKFLTFIFCIGSCNALVGLYISAIVLWVFTLVGERHHVTSSRAPLLRLWYHKSVDTKPSPSFGLVWYPPRVKKERVGRNGADTSVVKKKHERNRRHRNKEGDRKTPRHGKRR